MSFVLTCKEKIHYVSIMKLSCCENTVRPHYVHTTSALRPHYVHTTSALRPQYVRTTSAVRLHYVRTTSENLKNATITKHFRFVFEESSGKKKITRLS